MQRFLTTLFAMLNRDEEGATAVEYGLLVGLIAVGIIVIVGLLGGQLEDLFLQVTEQLPADRTP